MGEPQVEQGARTSSDERPGARPPGLAGRLMRQFSGPQGVLGHVAGYLMARMNRELNTWIIELLAVQQDDRVVDIGCGPGLAVEMAASRATRGFVAGVDRSEVMVGQARRRNAMAVRTGRVDVRCAPAALLPYPDGSFTKACVVNSLQFWPSIGDGVREIHRVLRPGGVLVVALRMRAEDAGQYDRRRFGLSEQRIAEIIDVLRVTGLTVASQRREVRGEMITALVARK